MGSGDRELVKKGWLTFINERGRITSMKRKSASLTVLSLALFYLLGAFCFSVAAPSTSIASTFPPCSETRSVPGMFPCEHPSFFCGLTAADNSAILSSVQTRDSSSKAQTAVVGIAVSSSPDAATLGLSYKTSILFGSPQKVPIHILNSVLSL